MGGCVGSHHDSSGSLNENSDGTGVALGRNQALKREKPKWKSDYPMTDGQLRSKRDEFWDTAPAFEGRKEIWDALKAAAQAFESNDHELAQAIIDGASITLPHVVQQLLDRVSEALSKVIYATRVLPYQKMDLAKRLAGLGAEDCCRYLLREQRKTPSITQHSLADRHSHRRGCSGAGALTECYDELGNRYQLPVYCLSPPVNMIEEKSDLESLEVSEPPPSEGQECQLRLRLSTGRDLRLAVRTTDTVQHMKRQLQAVEGVSAATQRWFFSGRPLTDKMKLEELKISRDYVVQVIISQPPAPLPTQAPPVPTPTTPTSMPATLPQDPTPVEN
ncbi:ubiquitin domain-containing protein 2 isoform X1 [Oncorhynchus kisutch]|uniref:ubiquitin domain-containing protein 2 isoform X1 n=1 Tax=Oncorhynchus kisutch TaxID=8019 RepID=UPI0012DEEFEA|nr:ubiquitin domain-containing protein 2 isoform X1 [Oncorhynchus kisutch]